MAMAYSGNMVLIRRSGSFIMLLPKRMVHSISMLLSFRRGSLSLLGTLRLIGSLLVHGTLRIFDSLTFIGTFRRYGSLTTNGALMINGSLSVTGTL
jgi:hypothetical protein